ncbi:hydrogenase accessory protein [Pseudooceanicola sp. CBS1P-1]|uniref:Hydrogenase expression/formation protein n=1 Tax=Pseudooceanicola albus TaxID=2692189 RepID=A0A6L7G6H1_9RHOB|nr:MULTISPECIES: hydrogenase accessory protein [Pseudooceanicola]MBT9384206.1 hydrogenase accessory protein [Pseudooceanicola endophyticus]MXN19695.1 hydrogenase accessory protein [Pseudooceanicola albus]
MTHPLVTRLTTELGWPALDDIGSFDAWAASPGVHVAFVPGDAARNLETPDVAIILPELRMTFQNAFDCAVIGDAIEATLREDSGVLKTPALIFYHDGICLGGIARVRDWDDYMARIPRFLSAPAAAE